MSGQGSPATPDPARPGLGGCQIDPVRPEALLACRPDAHRIPPSTVDERARRLSHEELAVAAQLASEGHRVRSLAERRGQGRTADLEVCGSGVEVKSFLSLPERDGRAPTAWSVCNKLLDARDQATQAVLFSTGSGLTEPVARLGVERFAARDRPGGITGVRIIGDGFDLGWSVSRSRGLDPVDSRYQHPSSRRERSFDQRPDIDVEARSKPTRLSRGLDLGR